MLFFENENLRAHMRAHHCQPGEKFGVMRRKNSWTHACESGRAKAQTMAARCAGSGA